MKPSLLPTLSPSMQITSTSTSPPPAMSSSTSPLSSSSQTSKCKQSKLSEVPLQSSRMRKMAWQRREHKRTIAKLRRMLPYDHNVIQCSELELINLIMDYIMSLQEVLQSQEDENHSSAMEIANLNRALSRFHLCTNKRRPLRPSKQLCT